MLKKIVVTAGLGAAIVGAGTAALASSGSGLSAGSTGLAASTASSPTASSSAQPTAAKTKPAGKHAGKHASRVRLGRALHGTWVTKNAKTNVVVTHDAIRGTVSSVSATSITVKAADGVTQTYQVASTTKVRKRVANPAPTPKTTGQKTPAKGKSAKAAASSIGAVKVGDKAVVLGTGTTTLTATRVVDGLTK